MLLDPAQPPLIGLPMDSHDVRTELRKQPNRCCPAADVGAGATLCPERTNQDKPVRGVGSGLLRANHGGMSRRKIQHSFDDCS